MKAVGVFEFGGPDNLKLLELPEPEPGPGEVRIRVFAAGVNPVDLSLRAGSLAARLAGRAPPYVPGMDAAGVIDKLGPGSESRFAIGDRVVAFVVPTGPHGGAYAQQVVVPAASTVAAPVGKTHFQAVTLLLNAFTARLALDALALRAGQPLAITGAAGAVGAYAIQLAKAERLTVIGDAGSISDEALVRSWGVDHVVPRGPGFSAAVHDAVGAGAAGLIDCANLAGLALPAIADSGGMVTLRGWTGPSTRGIVIHPISSMGATQSTPAFERLVEAAEDGTLTLRVADVLPAERAADAHRLLAAGGVRGRIVLDFGSLS